MGLMLALSFHFVLATALTVSPLWNRDDSVPARAVSPLELRALINTGDSENRVDLTFYSDGYLASDRGKFYSDAEALAAAMVNGPYKTVAPLLNFWAAFSPSQQRGIGNSLPANTLFGLHRIEGEYRYLIPENPNVALATSASLGSRSDYPILLGNDPYYGGADGGPLATVTASEINGPLVLAHELGHALIGVGEEYDGGFAYTGNNSATSPTLSTLPWAKWLSDPSRVDANGNPLVEKASLSLQNYAWTYLNTTAWQTQFQSTGEFSRYSLQFSLSGLPSKSDLSVTLDGQAIDWAPKEDIGSDRWFYNYPFDTGLSAGTHTLKFQLLNQTLTKAQLCSMEVEEYGNENEFKLETGSYGVYPTYDENKGVTYRPTNNDCLMRDITAKVLCKVCTDALWTNLLSHNISLIDNITESCHAGSRVLNLALLPLAEFRQTPVSPHESYSISWMKDGHSLEQFANQTQVLIPDNPVGTYSVSVKFSTDEVRINPELLQNTKQYSVASGCQET